MQTARAVLALICTFVLLQSCGGGGGNGSGANATSAPVQFSIDWAERGRAATAPSSALSAVLTLAGADPSNGDFTYMVNRAAAAAPYTGNYRTGKNAKIGTWPMTIQFYALPDAGGAVVASAQSTVTVQAAGTNVAEVTNSNTVASVEVMPDQFVVIGAIQDIAFTARDSHGATVAVTPGSGFPTSSDQLVLQLVTGQTPGQVKGIANGVSFVTVSVDGKVSPRIAVAVGASRPIMPQFTLTDLRTGSDDVTVPIAVGMNNKGEIVGYVTIGGFNRAFVWRNGVRTLLPELPGTQGNAAHDINDDGVIVGTSGTISHDLTPPVPPPVIPVVVWKNNAVTKIGQTYGVVVSQDIRINSGGQVAFASFENDATSVVLWQNGSTTTAYSGGGIDLALNDSGDIAFDVGTSFGESRATVWRNGAVSPLDRADYVSYAYAINNSGQIAGLAQEGSVIWNIGSKTVLPVLTGSSFCQPRAINGSGDVAGVCWNPPAILDFPNVDYRIVLWKNSTAYDATPPSLKGTQFDVVDINSAGQILITNYATSYLLTPK